MLGMMERSVYCYLTNFLRFSSWFIFLLQSQLVAFHQVMSFFCARQPFVPMDMHNSASCVMSLRLICRMFTISPAHLFFLFTFLIQHSISFEDFLGAAIVQSLFSLLFLMWVLLQMLYPFIRPFIFQHLGFPYPVVEPGQVQYARFILTCRTSLLLH